MHRLTPILTTLLLLVLATAASPQTEQRVALVIGNGTYLNAGTLKNPPNDAKAIAATLRRAGFDVIEREDLTSRGMREALRSFAEKLTPGGIGLFFYAGHGIQARGANYLIPIDAALAAEDDLRYETIDVQDVLNRLDDARVRLSIVILDACRDNPFLRSFRSAARGLAQIDAPRGTVIAYATAPGKEAADGNGTNGVYTAELLKVMSVPGLKLEEVFERVTDAVERETANGQTPWISSSFRGDFYFIGPPPATVAQPTAGRPSAPQPTSAPSSFDEREVEVVFWNTIKDSTTAIDFEDYLRRYPDGIFASLAQRRIEALKKPQQQALSIAPPPARSGQAIEDINATFVALRAVTVRSEPKGSAKELGTLSPDTAVDATGRRAKDWLRIAWNGADGYVSAPLMQEVDTAEVAGWVKIKGTRNAEEVEAFLKSYPNGFYASRATVLLASLRAAQTATSGSAQPQVAAAAPPAVRSPKSPGPHAPGAVFRDCKDCPEMVAIPVGRFMMGTEAPETTREQLPDEWAARERPRHAVVVSAPFALGRYPVTREEYARFVKATRRGSSDCQTLSEQDRDKSWRDPGFAQTDRDPVVCVNWDDAKSYVGWLSKITGKAYRLPTEAEWEYAARAQTTTARWWGDEIGQAMANCAGCGSKWDNTSTSPVGSFRANDFGLYDMLGNVSEWVEDCWKKNYNAAPGDASIAFVSSDCDGRVMRGGSWNAAPEFIRAGFRDENDAALRYSGFGFRVARTE
jgi:formylglycine-generating enzyme required for sulfatase activity/uncharacterized caspase-like protein